MHIIPRNMHFEYRLENKVIHTVYISVKF